MEREVGAAGKSAELRGHLIQERCAKDAFAWWCAHHQRTHGRESIGDADSDRCGTRPRGAIADAGGEREVAGDSNGGKVAHRAGGGVETTPATYMGKIDVCTKRLSEVTA